MRIVGVIAAVLGLAVALFAGQGVMDVNSMATNLAELSAAHGLVFDAADWKDHWLFMSVVMLAIGSGVFIAGALLALARNSGFVVLAACSAILGLIPWLLQALGYSTYTFERPSVIESVAFLGVAMAAVAAFMARRNRVRV